MSDAELYKHRSDCAVHNEPAYPAGPCDCGAEPPTSNRKKLRQANLRIGRQREKIAELLRTIADLSTQLYNSHDRADAAEAALDKAADRIEALTAKLAKAEWLLTDAAVQLEEGKIKTRRNRAGLIWQFLEEIKGESHDPL